MTPTADALLAFAESATLGSFSAAARKLGKSQSTVSTAIAHLEVDLGLQLFDRSSRKPTLTPDGQALLRRVEEVLSAHSRLDRAARELSQGLEPRLSVALSDTYPSDRFEAVLAEFAARYPELELECLIAECIDLVALVQGGRAQIGFVEAQGRYPPDVGSAAVAEVSETALYVAPTHPLAALDEVDEDALRAHRELRLGAVLDRAEPLRAGRAWSAPSYLMLMDLAQRGFGWAPIPRWLVQRYAATPLHELTVRGWPRRVAVDALWSRTRPLGPAGNWLLKRMLA